MEIKNICIYEIFLTKNINIGMTKVMNTSAKVRVNCSEHQLSRSVSVLQL